MQEKLLGGIEMLCSKCGNEIRKDAKFCSKCGASVVILDDSQIKENTNSGPSDKCSASDETIKDQSEDGANEKIKQNEFAKGDVRRFHIFKFIKYLYGAKQYWFLGFIMLMPIGSLFSLNLLIFAYVFGITCLTCSIAMNGAGQWALRFILGGRKIERNEQIEQLKNPINLIIEEARLNGLALPDKIEIYVVNYEKPLLYAVGMNTIIVSNGMSELQKDVFKAKVLMELYRIHRMDPDYLLSIVGSNVIGLIMAIFVLITSRIDMMFGDKRSSFWRESESKEGALVYYATIVCLAIYLGIGYLFTRKATRKNTFDADLYVNQCGYGEALCIYIDQIMPNKLPKKYKILELGHPSKDERIAALQNAGVAYGV